MGMEIGAEEETCGRRKTAVGEEIKEWRKEGRGGEEDKLYQWEGQQGGSG